MTTTIQSAMTNKPSGLVLFAGTAGKKKVVGQRKKEPSEDTTDRRKGDEFFGVMTEKLRALDAKITRLAAEVKKMRRRG